MDIRRHEPSGGQPAAQKVKYCLDRLEAADKLDEVDLRTQICEELTVEEVIGALQAAECEYVDQNTQVGKCPK